MRVGLSQRQKQIYKHIISKNYTALRSLQKGQKSSLVNIIMELKKCCNHASLIEHEALSNPDVSPDEVCALHTRPAAGRWTGTERRDRERQTRSTSHARTHAHTHTHSLSLSTCRFGFILL